MPNPFMRLGVPNQAEHKADPRPVDPIPEHEAEPNLPYRGLADRGGVEPNDEYEPFPGYAGTHSAEFVIEPPPEHVIPVRIVQEGARQRRVGRSLQIPVVIGAGPTLVLGQNDARVKALVRWATASAADVILFGGSPTEADPMQGHRYTGQTTQYEFVNEAQSSLFAVAPVIGGGSAAGLIVLLSVWETVAVEL